MKAKPESIRDKIIRLMKAQRCTARALIEGTGLPPSSVYDYLRGKRDFSEEREARIIDYLFER